MEAGLKSGNAGSYSLIIYDLTAENEDKIIRVCQKAGCDYASLIDSKSIRKLVILGVESEFKSVGNELRDIGEEYVKTGCEINNIITSINRHSGVISFRNKHWDFSEYTHIMGVINVTPDSFSDGGKFFSVNSAVVRALEMVNNGADFIDIGGESTRPGTDPVDEKEELRRILPVIERLAGENITVSVDTYKSSVALEAAKNGAAMINDISGAHFDPKIADVTAEYDMMLVLMHIQGEPRNMQKNPYYDDLMREIIDYLQEGIDTALKAGVKRDKIIVDPGIGFGKRLRDNLEIIERLSELKVLGCPIMLGPSRKSFIGKILDQPATHRIWGTAASCASAVTNGADILRVHDTEEMKQVVGMTDYLIGKQKIDE